MKSMPQKHGAHSNPWEEIGARQTTQTGGSMRSAAKRGKPRQLKAAPASAAPVRMTTIIECPQAAGEVQ